MFSFHLKVINHRGTSSYTTEGRSQLLPPHTLQWGHTGPCCCSSSALPRQGQDLACGRKSLCNAHSLWSGTNPVNTRSCQLCQHCHSSAAQHSTGQQCLEGKGLRHMEPGHISEVQEQTAWSSAAASCGFQNLKPLSPPINSHQGCRGTSPGWALAWWENSLLQSSTTFENAGKLYQNKINLVTQSTWFYFPTDCLERGWARVTLPLFGTMLLFTPVL